MKHSLLMPTLMGAAMGAMMLFMLHGVLTGNTELSGLGLAVFIAAHGVVVLGVMGLGLLSVSRFPRLKIWLSRVHRPNLRHVCTMFASAAATAGIIHLIHGGI